MKWKPFGHRTFYLVPFQMGGETESGLLIRHHDKLPIIYGRATVVHPSCRSVRPGDWVIFLPGRPTRLTTDQGSLYVLDERMVLGIVEPGDGRPWFVEEIQSDLQREFVVDGVGG